MKHILFLVILVSSSYTYATDAKNEWHATSLSEETIKKVQHAQYNYKKCVTDEMQKIENETLHLHKDVYAKGFEDRL